jgi:manganese/zinc/iron transport system substrate-binding protein
MRASHYPHRSPARKPGRNGTKEKVKQKKFDTSIFCDKSTGMKLGFWAMVLGVLLVAPTTGVAAEGRKIKATATTSMVGDLVRQVGGDRVEVATLMGPGVDPHLYKATAGDAGRLAKSDVIFYSGLMLEGRMADLFTQLGRNGRKVYAITESVPKDRLLEPAQFAGHYDPHLWFDVALWAQTVPTIVMGLSEVDPGGKADYEKRGVELQARLAELEKWCHETAAKLPAEQRILVTSHDAYNYFGRAYGFMVVGLQGVSTVSEAALSDMASLVDFIRQQKVKAIFVESSVNPAAIKRVADDAKISIGGELYSDAMGAPGEMKGGFNTGTYDGVVRYNLTTIVNALK